MNTIIENQFIEALARAFPRSEKQLNALQQSDAEILKVSENGPWLALTMDSIAEEIESGLYADPYLAGWMTVMVNASDLAAVGADPLGLLLNETLPASADDSFLQDLQRGIAEASAISGLPVLGGDTNVANHTELSACAIGILPENRYLSRIGCRPNELLYASGRLGAGNAFAFAQLQGLVSNGEFKPQPHFKQAKVIRQFATCCMDTSDGFIATVDQLMRLNHLGFDVRQPMETFLHPAALQIAVQFGVPQSAFLAGIHGEFELIFTIPASKNTAFLQQAKQIKWQPILLGKVSAHQGLRLNMAGRTVQPDTAFIRNLFDHRRGRIEQYIQEIIEYLTNLEKGA